MTTGNPPLHLALFQPEIPQNTGAAMRLTACMDIPLDIIEPTTFVWDDAKIRRSAMDYIDHVDLRRHKSWAEFRKTYGHRRVILLTTKSDQSYLDFEFKAGDIIMAGQESAGAPPEVHETVEARLTIPMPGGVRSMNVINACSMVIGEALRQVGNSTKSL